MKSFKQYLIESKNDNAYVFDVDDTLVTTDAKILVKDEQGNLIKKLTPAQYNTYIKNDNEYYDLSEFKNEDIFRKTAKPTKYFKVIKNVSDAIKRGESNSYIYILTARGNAAKNIIYRYLTDNGITVRPIEIHTIGDNPNKPVSELKKEVLQKIRNKHIGDVTFFDDDVKNITLANQIPGINARLVRK